MLCRIVGMEEERRRMEEDLEIRPRSMNGNSTRVAQSKRRSICIRSRSKASLRQEEARILRAHSCRLLLA
jgi:hypothetical protein